MILNVFTSGYAPDSRLLVVGVRSHTEELKFFDSLEGFVDYFLGTDDKIVIGFNILKWDVPYLLINAQASARFADLFKKMNYANIVDLYPILTFRNKGVIKPLSFYLEQEGISREFKGDQEILALLGTEKARAREEIGKKLTAIQALYWKLKEKEG